MTIKLILGYVYKGTRFFNLKIKSYFRFCWILIIINDDTFFISKFPGFVSQSGNWMNNNPDKNFYFSKYFTKKRVLKIKIKSLKDYPKINRCIEYFWENWRRRL